MHGVGRVVAGVVAAVAVATSSAASAAPAARARSAVPGAAPTVVSLTVSGPAGSGSAGPGSAASSPDVAYRAPVVGALTRRFDPPAVPWGSGHRGVDLAATAGEEVRSPGPGVVTFAGVVVGRGVVTVRHPDGLRSSLEPVTAAVRTGDVVATGAVLGILEAGGTHLGVHWGVRDADGYRDPLGLLPDAGRVVSSCTQLAAKVAQCHLVAQCQKLRAAKGCRVPKVA